MRLGAVVHDQRCCVRLLQGGRFRGTPVGFNAAIQQIKPEAAN
jgi:hypothetical protein